MYNNRGKRILCVAVAATTIFLLLAPVALTQSGGDTSTMLSADYALTWSTVDSGGWTFSTGGAYSLGGTAGQPDAGLLTGGDYDLGGGFWGGGALAVRYTNYLPLVLLNGP